MKRLILYILILMALLLGTQRASEAFSLNYLSGGGTAQTWVDESHHGQGGGQGDPNYAYSSTQISGIGSARATARLGGANISLSASVNSSIDYYQTTAKCGGDFSFQVAASPGDSGNSVQIAYEYDYFKDEYFFGYQWDPLYFPLIITVNGVTKVNDSSFYYGYPAESNGFLDVEVGDIIGLSCGIFADNVCWGGHYYPGFMDAHLYVSLSPVTPIPIPSALFLLGAGLFRLAAYKWRKSVSRS